MAIKTIAAVAAGTVGSMLVKRFDFHPDPRIDGAIKAAGGLGLAMLAGKVADGAFQVGLITLGTGSVVAGAAEYVPFLRE